MGIWLTEMDEVKRRWHEFRESGKDGIEIMYKVRRKYRPSHIGIPQKGDVCLDADGGLYQVFAEGGKEKVICEEVKK